MLSVKMRPAETCGMRVWEEKCQMQTARQGSSQIHDPIGHLEEQGPEGPAKPQARRGKEVTQPEINDIAERNEKGARETETGDLTRGGHPDRRSARLMRRKSGEDARDQRVVCLPDSWTWEGL